MKFKVLTAMISAMLATSASAQSQVALFGVADLGIEYITQSTNVGKTDGSSLVRMRSGQLAGSRIGFRGSEDLGGGLRAVFLFEGGFDLSTGGMQHEGRMFGRQAYVGFDGPAGTITLGRQYNLMFDAMLDHDPMTLANYSLATHDLSLVGRTDKAIKYRANINGFKLGALYSFGRDSRRELLRGSDGGQKNTGYEWSLSVGYDSGPAKFAVVYDQVKSVGAEDFGVFWSDMIGIGQNRAVPDGTLFTGAAGASAKKLLLAGSYAFGNVRAFAGYRYLRVDPMAYTYGTTSGTSDRFRSDLYWLGATWSATPTLDVTGAIHHSANRDLPAVTSYVIATDYKMSKRTDLYLNLSYINNRTKNGYSSAQGVNAGDTAEPGRGQFGGQVGVRHVF